jgi:hypothetical protein
MDPDGDDLQSLSGATLAEANEVEDRDQDELLGAGSSKVNSSEVCDFH